jgi:tRNA 2-selenouridine synthase
MSHPTASLFSAVHPFQIEVQDFESYALIVDVRAASAFAGDHLPGAVSVPCESVCPRDAGKSVPAALQEHVARLSAGDAILVYCDRGGVDAQAYAQPLREAGWTVDVLPGGWSTYRRWVGAGLELLPRGLGFRCLVAPPMSGLCVIVPLLREQGEQVLDLPELAGQRLIPGLSLLGDEEPTQEAFETRLLDDLRRFDPERVVWVCGSSELPAGLALPPALRDALVHAESIRIEVPIEQRARLWFDRIRSLELPAEDLLHSLWRRAPAEHGRGVEAWMAMLGAGRTIEALSEVIGHCVDPIATADAPTAAVLSVPSLEPERVAQQVRELVRDYPAAAAGA